MTRLKFIANKVDCYRACKDRLSCKADKEAMGTPDCKLEVALAWEMPFIFDF